MATRFHSVRSFSHTSQPALLLKAAEHRPTAQHGIHRPFARAQLCSCRGSEKPTTASSVASSSPTRSTLHRRHFTLGSPFCFASPHRGAALCLCSCGVANIVLWFLCKRFLAFLWSGGSRLLISSAVRLCFLFNAYSICFKPCVAMLFLIPGRRHLCHSGLCVAGAAVTIRIKGFRRGLARLAAGGQSFKDDEVKWMGIELLLRVTPDDLHAGRTAPFVRCKGACQTLRGQYRPTRPRAGTGGRLLAHCSIRLRCRAPWAHPACVPDKARERERPVPCPSLRLAEKEIRHIDDRRPFADEKWRCSLRAASGTRDLGRPAREGVCQVRGLLWWTGRRIDGVGTKRTDGRSGLRVAQRRRRCDMVSHRYCRAADGTNKRIGSGRTHPRYTAGQLFLSSIATAASVRS